MTDSVYEVEQLKPYATAIGEQGVRSFLITGAKGALLLDTGFGGGDLAALVRELTKLPLLVVNSHADRDHIGANGQFEFACLHPAEFDRYAQNGGQNARVIWEGDRVSLGKLQLEVILLPGHTPGSIALLDIQNRILYGGDSVQASSIYMFGAGRNLTAYYHSMQKLEERLGEFDLVYPAHGPLPLEPDIIPELRQAAEDVLAERLIGEPLDLHGQPVLEYRAGRVGFYCDRK